jgi:hypothetical protein
VLAVFGAGCTNSVVTRAQVPPPLTSTTLVSNHTPVTRLPSISDIESEVLAANPPTADEIAKAPINVLRTKSLANIKTKLDALNSAMALLGTLTHLGAAGMALERDELNSAIEGLTALQTQITSEQDIRSMRSEALQLVNYADVGTVIVPKVVLLAAADTVLRSTDNLNGQINQLQTRIDTAAGKGKNVGSAIAALNAVRGSTSQAAGLAGGLMTSVPLIAATDTNQINADNSTVAGAHTAAAAAQSGVGTVGAALQAAGA